MTTAQSNGRQLVIVIPAFNEEESISKVILEWNEEVSRWTPHFLLLVINDGSTDGTQRTLEELTTVAKLRLQVIHRENRGHGQTCLQGYRWAIEKGFPYVMQIDSDWQCDPRFFNDVWSQRTDYDVIYGQRVQRDDGFRRTLASSLLKFVVLLRSGALCTDPNVPYRLMRTAILPPILAKIPSDFFLANVALAILLKRAPGLRHGRVPISFRDRYGGQPRVRLSQFGFRALQLIRQLGTLR
jgi:glycosyltransferase involved in cell wall biosynthesis